MAAKKQRPACVLGFYQCIEQANGEICGGVLVTSHLGRPIEFQCSLPVRPNPTQQLLYGPTLRPFVLGELIAGALHDKLEAKPDLLFINDADAFHNDIWSDIPLLSFQELSVDCEQRRLNQHQLWITSADQKNFARLEKQIAAIPDSADLKEPLLRVEQALREATGEAA